MNINLAHAKQPIKIVTTIGQITDAVKSIAGDKAIVQGLMGAGVDPHLYKASESDVRKLAQADIIFYNGLFLESKMEILFEKMGRNKKTVGISNFIPKDQLLDSINYAGHYDPHVWFDITLWSLSVAQIEKTLSHFDPANKDFYISNATLYLEKLKKLNTYLHQRSQELSKDDRVLVTAHDAFRYFGKAYDFEVIGLQGLSTEAEAGTADVRKLADFITERKIRALFVESSVPERNIKAVQEAVQSRGWDVEIGGELFSDAMGTEGTIEGTYVGMLTHNIDTIVESLKER